MVDEYTDLFNDKIDHYEGVIRRGLTIRKFYYDDSDSEAEYPDFLNLFSLACLRVYMPGPPENTLKTNCL